MSLNSSFCTSVAIIVEGRHEGQKIPDMPIDRTDTRAHARVSGIFAADTDGHNSRRRLQKCSYCCLVIVIDDG